ncbi:MAG: DNA replication/repair protein RecF [Bacteroidaceae bacterium]|nr:DNA replication/repair protein RecF [Bacteroidaceae bacterium]
MILKKLTIINYKNIEESTLVLSENLNCFVGHNGVGKTNFLDAVYYLSFCKSAFSSAELQNIRHGEEFFMIEGEYVDEMGEGENVYCGMKAGGKKHFKRNGKEYRKLAEHIGMIPLIMLSPSDYWLIEGGGDERRKLMDMTISQCDAGYLDSLINYNRALHQRNVMLKYENPDSDLLGVLEEQMAEYGVRIYEKRCSLVRELAVLFGKYYSIISSDRECVSLSYKSHCQRGCLIDVIRGGRIKDLAVGFSLHGIHRDDLVMELGGFPIRREGSQGQNKSYIIALKLAQYAYLYNHGGGRKPLLLLDDIFDKLDAERVERIVGLVGCSDEFGQIFITDTNREHIDKIIRRQGVNHKLFELPFS